MLSFERVAQEFEKNFQQRGEVGTPVFITLEGKAVNLRVPKMIA
jgi:hypothetical protein